MTEPPTLPRPPSAELLERILAALDQGAPAEPATIALMLATGEAEVRGALAAVAAYRSRLAALRAGLVVHPAATDADLPPGTRVGDFVIEARIGAGAMGTVYRARQISLGDRPVALKILPSSLAARDPRFVERFRREATLAATIHHPRLAEVHGSVADGAVLGFAMRLVEGRTLQDVLGELAQRQNGAVRATSATHVRRAVLIARGIADALAEIHAKGLVHRDVKPSNVILEGAGADPDAALDCRPVLVDFGLLRPQGDTELTGTRTLLGTPAYAAHETQLGRDVDARADVFSLGALLHDLLTLTSPGTRGPATKGLGDLRAINPSVDVRLQAIVDMALQERRELRYGNGGALREELDRWLRGEAILARPAGAFGKLRLWSRRNPVGAAKGALAAVATVVVVAVATWIGGFAWNTTALARAAVAAEAAGDLLAAAGSYRALAATTNAGLLFWLHDDLERAALFAEGSAVRFFPEAIGHYRDGENALAGSGSATTAPEHDFARAADRLKNVLFGPDEPGLGETIRRTLLREARDGVPEFRRRIAMDAWADYLSLQRERRVYPAELPEVLRRAIADRSLGSDTREAAVAALGTIPTREGLAAVIALLADPDPAVANRARAVVLPQYDWIHHRSADAEYRRIDSSLLAELARRQVEWTSRFPAVDPPDDEPPGYEQDVYWRLACFEHPLGGTPPPSQRIEVPEARELVDHAHRAIREFLDTNPDLEDDRVDPDGSKPVAQYRCATGRAILLHDAAIWRPPARDITTRELVTREPEADSRYGLLDFWWAKPGQPPLATGTIAGATCMAAEPCLDSPIIPGQPQHLRMLHPGYSNLRVRTVVPRGVRFLRVHLLHAIGTRQTLRNQGQATCRFRVAGEPGAIITDVPVGGTTLLAVTEDVLRRRGELELVLEYLHGNTSYWIRRIELEWGEDPYNDRYEGGRKH